MAPPIFVQLGKNTKTEKYFDEVYKKYFDVVDFIFSYNDSLFYRDQRFINRLNDENKKIFWSRGNGWVVGGLVRILKHLPSDSPYYLQFQSLLKKILIKLIAIQPNDHIWRTSLLSPDLFPDPDTSGTSFFCYGLAYAINTGILDKDIYEQYLIPTWKELTTFIDEDGKLTWVQQSNSQPGEVNAEDYHEYGAGAFLLAAGEMFKYYSN